MYRSTITFLLSMLMALLVIPTGSSFAGTGRDKKASTRLSQKKSPVTKTKARSPKRSVKSKVFSPSRKLRTPVRKPKAFQPTRSLLLKTSPSKTKFPTGLTKSPRKPPLNLKPDITSKLPAVVNPDLLRTKPRLTGKLPPRITTVPDLSRKLPPRIKPEMFNKLDRVGKLKGLTDYSKVLEKVGKTQIKPLKLEKFNPKLGQILTSEAFKTKAPLALKAKKAAILNLHLHGGCHWWIDMVIGCHWDMHHCGWWDICYTPGYWHCWTPCHYHVVYCPPVAGYVSSAWYFGVDCMLIPDLAAYGIQDVKVNSPAERAGLKPGDLIVSINGNAIENETVMRDAIQISGGYLELGVIRDGSEEPMLIPVELQRVLVSSH